MVLNLSKHVLDTVIVFVNGTKNYAYQACIIYYIITIVILRIMAVVQFLHVTTNS